MRVICRADYCGAIDDGNMILRGDPKLASAALKLARHVHMSGSRGGTDDELLGVVLELIEFAQSACESPLISPVGTHTFIRATLH
jgi:hypothetical protein